MSNESEQGNMSKLRWGILGAADIARKNWKAIWNSENGRVAGVASRDRSRAEQFIDLCQNEAPFDIRPRLFDDYEQLLNSPEIEAVYLPLPTAVRLHWVKRAAEAGKHVVCEKPCAISTAELKAALEICQRNQVQFVDGVMFMHSQRLERILHSLHVDQHIGQIRRISSAFTFVQDEDFLASNIRVRSELEPDGCLGDLGWYCIRFLLCVMRGKLPTKVSGRILRNYQHPRSHQPVPTEFSAEAFFEQDVSATFYCSFVTELEQWALVSGTRGNLRVEDFVLPFSGHQLKYQIANPVFEVNGCDFEMKPNIHEHLVDEPSHGRKRAQEANLFRRVAAQIRTGKLNQDWVETALKTQLVMDACRESAKAQGQLKALTAV